MATVTTIARTYILVREGKEIRRIRLWGERKRAAQGGRKVAQRPPSPGKQPVVAKPKTDYSKGVKKISEYKYQVDRGMLNEQLEDLSALGMQARIVPNYRNGKYQGFKLIGVRPGSLYRSIGIRSGDIVKRINGEEINSPNKAIQLFEKLRNEGNIALDIERRGQAKTLQYNIQ